MVDVFAPLIGLAKVLKSTFSGKQMSKPWFGHFIPTKVNSSTPRQARSGV